MVIKELFSRYSTMGACIKVFVFLGSCLMISCENDIELVNSVTNNKVLPDIEGTKMEIIYTDSARLKAKVLAPLLYMFETNPKPYTEFPKGIHVYFYNDSSKVNGEVLSNYAIYDKTTELWEARGNVVAFSPKGDRLNTEQLFWDMKKNKFYSSKFTSITTQDGDQHNGEGGFESNEDFSVYKLFSSSGSKSMKDEAL